MRKIYVCVYECIYDSWKWSIIYYIVGYICSCIQTDRVAEYSDEDEEAEFSSGEFNDESNELAITGYDQKRDYNPAKHDMRKYRNKLQRSGIADIAIVGHHPHQHHPVDSDSEFEMKDKSSSRAKFSRVSHSQT